MAHESLPETLSGRLDTLLARLDRMAAAVGRRRPKRGHGDSYTCCCPAHDDKTPSLAVRMEGGKILLHCFAGCTMDDVITSIGMPPEALFDDYHGERGPPPSIRWNGQGKRAEQALRDPDEGAERPPALPFMGFDPEAGDRIPLPPVLEDFLALDFPPIEPILGPFATQQINLVYAPDGAGKTMFGLSTAYAMAEGRDFIGWQSSGPRRVLYVDGEMAARMIQERFGQVTSSNLYVANLPGWWTDAGGEPVNLTTESAQELLDLWVSALGIDVVILDNFMSLAWRDGTSFSSDEIWTPVKRWCVAQRAAGRTVILIDHANQSGAVFGTKTKRNIMDLILEISAEDEDEIDPDAGLSMAIKETWIGLKFNKHRGFLVSDPAVNQKNVKLGPIGSDWESRSPVDPLLRDITAMREKGISIRDIAKDLGVSYSKVQRIWKRVQASDSL